MKMSSLRRRISATLAGSILEIKREVKNRNVIIFITKVLFIINKVCFLYFKIFNYENLCYLKKLD